MKKAQLRTKSQLPITAKSNANFSKYDFVKSYIATSSSEKKKKEKEEEAVIIADAIKDHQEFLLSNLSTKDELKIESAAIREELQAESTDIRKELKAESTDIRKEIKISMLTTIISLGAIIALIEKFIN